MFIKITDFLYLSSAPSKGGFFVVLTGLMIFGVNYSVFAADIPTIRELPSNAASLNNQVFKNDKDNIYKSKDITKKLERNLTVTETKKTTQLKGGIAELKAIVGKSQLIKFDEPVKRISITDPDLADIVVISPKEMLINGKTGGETSLIIWGEVGDPVMFNLFVQNDSMNFIKEVKKIAPNDDIKINFVNSGDQKAMKVALSGRISSTITRDKIKNLVTAYGYTLVDMTEAMTPQVMLEVKIIEITKTLDKTSGTTPKLYINNAGEKINALTKFTYNLKFNADGTYNGVINQPGSNLELALKKAESEGTAKILAEPRLMAINGQAASFNAGEQIPVVKGRDEYGGLIIDYKDSGVNVTFTPTILEESGRVLLKISPEINEPTTSAISTIDGFPIYGFTTRKTDTTVELEDNQTMVIGGLIRRKSDLQKTKVPFFSNLPIIGNLLGDSTYSNKETELIIFVTPTIIKTDDVVNGV